MASGWLVFRCVCVRPCVCACERACERACAMFATFRHIMRIIYYNTTAHLTVVLPCGWLAGLTGWAGLGWLYATVVVVAHHLCAPEGPHRPGTGRMILLYCARSRTRPLWRGVCFRKQQTRTRINAHTRAYKWLQDVRVFVPIIRHTHSNALIPGCASL